jgi:hypothetical protein
LLIASLNFVWPVFRSIAEAITESIEESINPPPSDHFTISEVCYLGPRHETVARFWIELLMLMTVFGSRMKGLRGNIVTILGLSGATFVYLSWWQVVFRISRNAEVPIRPEWHFGYLYGGNIVDLFLAALIAWLIVMNVSLAFQQFLSPQPRS